MIVSLLALLSTLPLVAGSAPLADSVAVRAVPESAGPRADSSLIARAPISTERVYVLPEVRVERDRLASARRRLPTAFVTELRPANSPRAFETLSETLGEAAGVHVLQYGGLGAFSTVSLRGAPAGHVAILLDGVPLTSAAHGVVNLADLPVSAVERIEVYRGLSPLGLGVAAPGGAINLVTVAGAAPADLRVTRGSFGTWEGRGTTGLARGAFTALAHAGYQGSRGDFLYHDDNGTPFNAADDSLSTRLNDRFDAATGLLSLAWRPSPRLTATVREDFFHKAQGLPGLGAVPALHPRLAFQRSLTSLEVAGVPGGAWPRLELRGGLERERSRLRDRAGELGLGAHDTDDRAGGENAAATVEWAQLPLGFAAEAAGSWREERARLRDAADTFADPPGSRRTTLGASATLQLHAWDDRITLHSARRWDRLVSRLRGNGVAGSTIRSDVTSELNVPQLGGRLAVGRGLELRGNWTRAQRVPDFLELFGNQGSVLGNPQLLPESAENWDAGASWAAEGARWRVAAEWAHFESDAHDLVLYVRNSQSSVRAQNVSRAEIRGEEFSLRGAAPGGLALSGSFTAQSARDRGPIPFWNGRRLPQRPEREAWARLDWTHARLRAAFEAHHLGENWLDRANRQRVAARTLLGASLSFAPGLDALRVTLEGKNLGNQRAADVGGFPLPGRSLFVSCQFRFGPIPTPQP